MQDPNKSVLLEIYRDALQAAVGQQTLVQTKAGSLQEATCDLISNGPTGTGVMELIVGLKV